MRAPHLRAALSVALLLAAPQVAPADRQPAAPAPAEEPRPAEAAPAAPTLSLAEVLETAVRQSPTLSQARIDVDVAEAQVLAASGIEDWLLAAQGSYSRRRDKPVAGNVIGAEKQDQLQVGASISKLLPWGGTVSLGADLSRSQSLYGIVGTETTQFSTNLTLSLDQPLLRGFGRTATLAPESRAELARDAARLQREADARTLVRDLVGAYWELTYAWADLEIRKSSLVLTQERRRLTQAGVDLGSTAPTELLAVDQVIAQNEEEILVAELTVTQRSLALRRQAGLEIGPGAVDLATGVALAATPEPLALDASLDRALAASPELAVLATREKGARLEVEVAENGLLPRLDLSLSAGPLGTADKLGTAIENTAKAEGYAVSAGLSFQQALPRDAAQGEVSRTHAELRRVAVSAADVKAQLSLAVAQAVKLGGSAAQRMQISQRAIELSEKNIKAEVGRFELGKSTNFDVLQRQEELKQARLRYARAVVDYLDATAQLDALTGAILPKYGITLDEKASEAR